MSRDREVGFGQEISRGKDLDLAEGMPCFKVGEVEIDLVSQENGEGEFGVYFNNPGRVYGDEVLTLS